MKKRYFHKVLSSSTALTMLLSSYKVYALDLNSKINNADRLDFNTISSPFRMNYKKGWSLGGEYTFSSTPLILKRNDGSTVPLIDGLHALDMSLLYGLNDWLQIGIMIPGENPSGIVGPYSDAKRYLNNIVIEPKIYVHDNIAFIPVYYIPTTQSTTVDINGQAVNLPLGKEKGGYGAKMSFGLGEKGGTLTAIQIGAIMAPEEKFREIDQSLRFQAGFGISQPLTGSLRLLLEAYAEKTKSNTPLEALASIEYKQNDFVMRVGAGTGDLQNSGSNTARVLANFAYYFGTEPAKTTTKVNDVKPEKTREEQFRRQFENLERLDRDEPNYMEESPDKIQDGPVFESRDPASVPVSNSLPVETFEVQVPAAPKETPERKEEIIAILPDRRKKDQSEERDVASELSRGDRVERARFLLKSNTQILSQNLILFEKALSEGNEKDKEALLAEISWGVRVINKNKSLLDLLKEDASDVYNENLTSLGKDISEGKDVTFKTSENYFVNASQTLNVRSTPKMEDNIVGHVRHGDEVSIVGNYKPNSFVEVQIVSSESDIKTKPVFVSSKYLSKRVELGLDKKQPIVLAEEKTKNVEIKKTLTKELVIDPELLKDLELGLLVPKEEPKEIVMEEKVIEVAPVIVKKEETPVLPDQELVDALDTEEKTALIVQEELKEDLLIDAEVKAPITPPAVVVEPVEIVDTDLNRAEILLTEKPAPAVVVKEEIKKPQVVEFETQNITVQVEVVQPKVTEAPVETASITVIEPKKEEIVITPAAVIEKAPEPKKEAIVVVKEEPKVEMIQPKVTEAAKEDSSIVIVTRPKITNAPKEKSTLVIVTTPKVTEPAPETATLTVINPPVEEVVTVQTPAVIAPPVLEVVKQEENLPKEEEKAVETTLVLETPVVVEVAPQEIQQPTLPSENRPASEERELVKELPKKKETQVTEQVVLKESEKVVEMKSAAPAPEAKTVEVKSSSVVEVKAEPVKETPVEIVNKAEAPAPVKAEVLEVKATPPVKTEVLEVKAAPPAAAATVVEVKSEAPKAQEVVEIKAEEPEFINVKTESKKEVVIEEKDLPADVVKDINNQKEHELKQQKEVKEAELKRLEEQKKAKAEELRQIDQFLDLKAQSGKSPDVAPTPVKLTDEAPKDVIPATKVEVVDPSSNKAPASEFRDLIEKSKDGILQEDEGMDDLQSGPKFGL